MVTRMASFLLADGAEELAALLRGRGHEVTTSDQIRQELHPKMHSPPQHMLLLPKLNAERLILVTPDRALAKAARNSYPSHPGIVLCPDITGLNGIARLELVSLIDGVVSARLKRDGHTDGLFYEPFMGKDLEQKFSGYTTGHRPGKKPKRRR
jgi:hypothetical protein